MRAGRQGYSTASSAGSRQQPHGEVLHASPHVSRLPAASPLRSRPAPATDARAPTGTETYMLSRGGRTEGDFAGGFSSSSRQSQDGIVGDRMVVQGTRAGPMALALAESKMAAEAEAGAGAGAGPPSARKRSLI